ncbi:unnamed protein product [Durusdinium trenchii]|uniref:RWD domain-containing protein n=1 Tax=Durusdinium trenchii TaxID=1381693 RepID=A0ABP0KG23_9DINO
MEVDDAPDAKQDSKQKEKTEKNDKNKKDSKGQGQDSKAKKAPRSSWEPPPFQVPPRFCPGDSSVAGLPDRQENELMVIKEIFAGAVEELSVDPGAERSESTSGQRPSTPVRRYRVRLSAGSADGPTAQLEVSYGRLYPMETPRLLVKVSNLTKDPWQDLTQRVAEEVERAAGQECVFQVCSVISDLLRQHHDPSNEIPLYERMQRREAEEAKLKEEAARHDRELAKKRAVEEWEKQKQAERQRMERYEEKRRAVARVADGRDPHSWEG